MHTATAAAELELRTLTERLDLDGVEGGEAASARVAGGSLTGAVGLPVSGATTGTAGSPACGGTSGVRRLGSALRPEAWSPVFAKLKRVLDHRHRAIYS